MDRGTLPQAPRRDTALADQGWVANSMAFLRELDKMLTQGKELAGTLPPNEMPPWPPSRREENPNQEPKPAGSEAPTKKAGRRRRGLKVMHRFNLVP